MSDLKGTLEEGYRVRMSIRDHEVFADEPIDVGGTNTAVKPSELILSGLASCKLITMRMYANRKGWDLQNAHIELSYIEKGDPTIVRKNITFEGDLSEDQIKRLRVISGRCPVAKMLSNSIIFQELY